MKSIFFSLLTFILMFSTEPSFTQSSSCGDGGNQNGGYGDGGDTSNPNKKNNNSPRWPVPVIGSADPNELDGPLGYENKKWVSINDRLIYTIHFENDPKFATAPAQNVFIRFPIDPKININSLQLSDVGFGRYRFSLPAASFTTQQLDVRDSMDLLVDLTAGIDVVNHEIFWRFRSVDPATGLPPADANHGFLPVNDSVKNDLDTIPGKGQGFVTFSLKPISTAKTGDTAFEKASIIFDIEAPIETNSWTNTIDAVAPTSKITGASVFRDTITLHWSGQDDPNGSGVKEYALYYSESDGPFALYQQRITDTTIKFVGTPGKSYCFYTVASDNTNNKENFKTECEGSATLPLDGSVLPITWLYFKVVENENDAIPQWATISEINSNHFVIERSFDGINFNHIGKVKAAGTSSTTKNYSFVDKNALNLNYTIIYYRIKQVDNDGKFNYSIIVPVKLIHNSEKPLITAYPNPFTQSITLKIVSVNASDQTNNVALYTTDGKKIYQKNIINRGSSTILLDDLPSLSNGIYLLTTTINGKMYTINLIRR